jgi:transcriptional regulator with XRE-family HTH domain
MRPRQGKDQDRGLSDDHGPEQPEWGYLGRLVRERRAELGLTQAEVHSAGGPSPATLYLLESGHRDSYRPHILRRLERALGWRANSVRRVLAGGRPTLDDEDETTSPIREDRTNVPNGHAWMASFRQLPIAPRDKLLILSNLLEETIAELSTAVNDGPPVSNQIS